MLTSKLRKPNPYSRRHCVAAYRSGLEEANAALLKSILKRAPAYEKYFLEYTIPSRVAHYTPDFVLPNGIIIETKGRFIPEDRQKHILIKQQHPELDIRFVFTNSRQKLYKGSKTSYADWCNRYGFMYADKRVPLEWISEPPMTKRVKSAKELLKPRGERNAKT